MKKKLLVLALLTSMSMASYADIKAVEAALDMDDAGLAQQTFNALTTEEKSNVAGQVLKGRLLLAKDETEDAFDYFEALQEKHEKNVDINYYLGISAVIMAQKASIFSKLGYAKDFIKAMERTVVLKPDHQDALTTLIGFHLNAPGIAGGDSDKALVYAKQLKKYDAEQGYSQIANVYWQTEKPELAEKMIIEGLELFPESGDLYFTRAMANITAETWGQARTDLILAAKYAKDDEKKGEALYQQGKVSVKSGDEAELGIEVLIQALPLANKQYQPWVNYRLAQLYLQQKEQVKANEVIAKIDVSKNDDLEDKVNKLKKKLKKLTG
ncbi:MAG: tetratricopeptide repeat protein [Cognaticolwellia sp.]